MKRARWQWFGHAGHFICGRWCRFHLATKVEKYFVSTVGEYWPERPSREIHARFMDPKWLGENQHLKGDEFDHAFLARFDYLEVGLDRKFETMVFKAGKPCKIKECWCGMPAIDGRNVDFLAANDPGTATKNHRKLCKKWAEK